MRKLQMNELNRLSEAEFKQSVKLPYLIVLDNVRSLHNVGSAFRTGDAFKVEKIYLCGITGTPPHREINKTALGATDTVDWEHAENTLDLVKKLKLAGWTIVVLEQTDSSTLLQNFQPDPEARYAFIFGNEVFGVSDEVVDFSHHRIEIPQFGTKHSLNVSVSVGIICWHYILHAGIKN